MRRARSRSMYTVRTQLCCVCAVFVAVFVARDGESSRKEDETAAHPLSFSRNHPSKHAQLRSNWPGARFRCLRGSWVGACSHVAYSTRGSVAFREEQFRWAAECC